MRTWLNDVLVQSDTTADLLFPFPRLIADLSQLITLEAGRPDTDRHPGGRIRRAAGDRLEVEVDAPDAAGTPTSGRLVTDVVAGSVAFTDAGARPSTNELQRIEAWVHARRPGSSPSSS